MPTSLFTLFAQVVPQPVPELPWFQQGWFTAILALVVLMAPFFLGHLLAGALRMTDYGWRIGLVLFAVVAGTAICWLGWPPRLGIDLSGGVILVYEVDPSKTGDHLVTIEDRIRKHLETIEGVNATVARTAGDKIEVTLPDDNAAETSRVEKEILRVGVDDLNVMLVVEARPVVDGKRVLRYRAQQDTSLDKSDMDKMVGSIGKRVNPGGQKEVTVRQMGNDRIEVIIPRVDKAEVDVIKEKISTAGALKFRILANRNSPLHRDIIDIAEQSDARQVKRGEEVLAEWVPVDTSSFREVDDTVVSRELKPGQTEILVIDDDLDVLIGDRGGKLTRANSSFDPDTGRPCVNFSFDAQAANLFGELTGTHVPDTTSGLKYALGIVLDDKLKTAPTLQSRISSQGQITGNFTEEDVQFLVDILNAGSLPAALSKVPVAEYNSSAQLGQDTIRAGAYAMIFSTGAILVFMLVYYRFAGLVANLAVLLNIVLVLALLILIKAHLTLAGLAGLVLSVGMSVDANVLIYERMREETERGAALRMAIRNGFSRAMSTIIDSNLTTLIVGVVLYIIGSDQLRGFATTLILGLMLNLFTAVYCARVVFDIAERRRWITELKMLKLFGRPNFDFIGMAKPAIAASLIFIAIGLAAAIVRGSGLFGIDFTGGSAVQVVFKDPTDIGDVRNTLAEVPGDLPDLSVSAVVSGEQAARDSRFNINTSNPEIKDVEKKLEELFPGKLKTYSMKYRLASASALPTESAATSASPEKSATESKTKDAGKNTVGEADKDEANNTETSKAGAGKQESESNETSQTPRTGFKVDDISGSIVSTSPEAVLLAQADQAGASAEQPKSDVKTKQPEDSATNVEPSKTEPAPKSEESATPEATVTPAAPMSESKPAAESTTPAADAGTTTATLNFPDGISHPALEARLLEGAKQAGFPDAVFDYSSPDPDFTPGSSRPIVEWTVKSSLTPQQTETLLKSVQNELAATPIFPATNSIGGKVAGDTKVMAGYALFISNLLIIIYVWVRFQNLVFGLAAVVALIHDVAVAVAALALSYWLAPYLGFLQVDQFKISLEVVAALLTIVGFSINDTIVIFDRIREVRGKSPDITATMINRALNETLSRTILTAGTVFIVTLILFLAGGEGIHAFAFAMLIGVIAGSYSSLFIAAPLVLWMRRQQVRGRVRQVPTAAVPASGAA